MISDTDIKTILNFTSGEVIAMSEDSSGKSICFGAKDASFELVILPRTSTMALLVKSASRGAFFQYEVPVTSVTTTPESFEPGGVQLVAGLHFYGGTSGRRVLVIYRVGESFTVEPIWDVDPADAENAQ